MEDTKETDHITAQHIREEQHLSEAQHLSEDQHLSEEQHLSDHEGENNNNTEKHDIATILHPDYELTKDEDEEWKFGPKQVYEKLLWIFYIKTWIRNYNREWLKGDIKSGLMVVGMAIPQAIAYTGVIGVSPSLGLYTACIGLSLYPLLGTARHLTIGCSSLTTILTAAILVDFVPANNSHNTLAEYTTQVKTLAFAAGIFYTALAIFGLGFVASFLAYPVLLGFTGGAALQIASSQIKYCFALAGHGTDTISNLKLLKYLDETNWRAFACTISTLFLLLSFKVIPKKWPTWKYSSMMKTMPMTLAVIIFFTLINYGGRFLHHATNGHWNKGTHKAPEIVGVVELKFPDRIDVDTSLLSKYPNTFLLETVSMCVVEFTAFFSVAGSYAVKFEYDLIPNRELYAHGIVNLIGSLFGIYPAGGVIVHAPLAGLLFDAFAKKRKRVQEDREFKKREVICLLIFDL
ncbi:sulfate permease [Reticulomyxa filosa]|uniref:Sulfate permease n=1 Tax=Reticulomyxa filosa TaxID=46433 RepID=X6NQC0_RETFI|nr:sulfate permease [Reticulomyxa filosa]|eukprot:ETO27874.1 sulfate permease [Reticulomyxa filosa]